MDYHHAAPAKVHYSVRNPPPDVVGEQRLPEFPVEIKPRVARDAGGHQVELIIVRFVVVNVMDANPAARCFAGWIRAFISITSDDRLPYLLEFPGIPVDTDPTMPVRVSGTSIALRPPCKVALS